MQEKGEGKVQQVVQSWDTALKAGAQHDASVCLTVAQIRSGDGGGAVQHRVLDVWRRWVEYPDLKRAVIAQAAAFQPHAILIEDKASGQSLIQDLRRESNLPILAVMPQGDKVTRLARVSPMIEAGQVWLPHHAVWLSEFEQEVCAFPHGDRDDQVDALSQYLGWVRTQEWQSLRIRAV